MKIKLLKDIPGYRAGEMVIVDGDMVTARIIFYPVFASKNESLKSGGFLQYPVYWLIENGWAEEVKDEIDIEEVRNYYLSGATKGRTTPLLLEDNEREWFTAYRIVKAVIEKLNGDWKPDLEKSKGGFELYYDYFRPKIGIYPCQSSSSINPQIKDISTAEKVISLCEPELKVLFGV